MELNRIIALYMDDCHARQLRARTMQSYEQSLRLFSTWLEEKRGVTQVEVIKDSSIITYHLHAASIDGHYQIGYNIGRKNFRHIDEGLRLPTCHQ